MGVTVVLHGELLDLTPSGNRTGPIGRVLDRRGSVKDLIESLGPPHTEVGRIESGGQERDFSHVPDEGEELLVFPVAPPLDVTRPSRLRPDPLPGPAFAVDVNVGKLAVLMRLLGLDAAHDRTWRDRDLARLAEEERRAVLSRDRGLLKRRGVTFGRLIRAGRPEEQLRETLDFFGLTGPFAPFTRCLRCNVPLETAAKAEVEARLPPMTKRLFDRFSRCPSCGRVYWAGSHHDRMAARLRRLGLDPDSGRRRPDADVPSSGVF